LHGVSGVAKPDLFIQSLESYDLPISRKSEANAADDFYIGILNAEFYF
jgi:hypothetical protein